MLLLLLLCGALVASGAHDDNRLATCQASTHFECGRQIGEQQARRITNTLRTKYAASLAEFISTPTGNELYHVYLDLHSEVYPHLLEEIKGTAVGAKVSFQSLFALNIEFELISKGNLSTDGFRKGCSDFHLSQPTINAWGHNEDGDAADRENGFYFVSSTVQNQSYFAFAYTGRLPGWAWGFNNFIVQTVNGLYVPPNTKPGLGINFVARDLLSSLSIEDAIDRASSNKMDGGSHFNLGSLEGNRKRVSVETSWQGTTVSLIEPPWYAHFNAYLHTDNPPLGDYTSSIYRLARVSTLATRTGRHAVTTNMYSILDVLGDNATFPYCVFRCNTQEDPYITFLTLLIDLSDNASLRIYTSQTSSEAKDNSWYKFNLQTVNISQISLPPFP